MLKGVSFALAAGLLWGLVFIAPQLLPDYPATLQSFGRYLAFGLIALPLGLADRKALARFCRADWLEALRLAAIGNLLYYLCLSGAILRAGGALPTMIIGTLPVVIAICANLRNHRRDGRLPWRRLIAPLALIALGIAAVNRAELARLPTGTDGAWRYVQGVALAIGAVICWTWYPLRNADWLRHHPDRNPRVWATAQGLATLPLAAVGYALTWGWSAHDGTSLPMPFGPRPMFFCAMMLVIGLCASWLGTLCWNAASQRLPTAIAGQLIVFETLAALAYTYLLRGAWPQPAAGLGIVLLLAGVLVSLRIKPVRSV